MRCDGSSGPIRYSSTTLGFTHTSASAWIISTSTAHAVEYTCIGTCIGAAPQISAHERAGRRKAGSWSCSALTRRRVTPLLFSCSSREKGRKGELERRFGASGLLYSLPTPPTSSLSSLWKRCEHRTVLSVFDPLAAFFLEKKT